MMRVEFRTRVAWQHAGREEVLGPGDVRDVPELVAESFVARGWARRVTAPHEVREMAVMQPVAVKARRGRRVTSCA